MSQTFWEKWRHRITGAWDVMTGRAYAAYHPSTQCGPFNPSDWGLPPQS